MTFFSDLLDLLRTLGYQVYDTDVPETPNLPYIVAWGGTANHTVNSQCRPALMVFLTAWG